MLCSVPVPRRLQAMPGPSRCHSSLPSSAACHSPNAHDGAMGGSAFPAIAHRVLAVAMDGRIPVVKGLAARKSYDERRRVRMEEVTA